MRNRLDGHSISRVAVVVVVMGVDGLMNALMILKQMVLLLVITAVKRMRV